MNKSIACMIAGWSLASTAFTCLATGDALRAVAALLLSCAALVPFGLVYVLGVGLLHDQAVRHLEASHDREGRLIKDLREEREKREVLKRTRQG